jgi:hypothetical protein
MKRLRPLDIWLRLVDIARTAMGEEGLERRGLSMAFDGGQLQIRCGDRDTTVTVEDDATFMPLEQFTEAVLRPTFATVYNVDLPCLCGARQDAGGALPCGH